MLKLALAATILAGAGTAYAEDVIIERERPAPVEVRPAEPPDTVVIERRRPDCRTTSTHAEDDTGASSTMTRRDCN